MTTTWMEILKDNAILAKARTGDESCFGGLASEAPVKHAHYHKDVSKLTSVDVYRVLDLFGVTHPCAQHAAKKVLCAGIRGAKDIDKDIQEAIDTLVRWQAMRLEDCK